MILKKVLNLISPDLRTAMESLIKDLYVRAKQTNNTVDDFLVIMLAAALKIKIDD